MRIAVRPALYGGPIINQQAGFTHDSYALDASVERETGQHNKKGFDRINSRSQVLEEKLQG